MAITELITTKICTKCFRELPFTPKFFYRNKDSPDGFYSVCIECRKTNQRKYHKFKINQKTFGKNEKIDFVVCQICGRKLKQIHNLHLRTHNFTPSGYLNLYPDALLTCEKSKKKNSKSKKDRTPWNKGKTGVYSEETRKKISERMKGKKISEKQKKKISQSLEGHEVSEETRKKISESRKEGYRTGRLTVPINTGRGNHKFRWDLKQYFRCNWEANLARILNNYNIQWQYEPKRFDLGEYTYLPDFYLPNIDMWIEVKGYIKPENKEKVEYQLKEFSKDHKLLVIDKNAYKQLSYNYKHFIPNWEV